MSEMNMAEREAQGWLEIAADCERRLTAAEAQVWQLREALMFYAEREHYPLPLSEIRHFELLRDGGTRARIALAATEPKL